MITKEMSIGEVLAIDETSAPIMMGYSGCTSFPFANIGLPE
jgi:hypothetical protein